MRRRRIVRRSQTIRILVFLLLVLLFFLWRLPRVTSPLLSSSSKGQFNWNGEAKLVVDTLPRVVVRTGEEFVKLALGLVVSDLEQEGNVLFRSVKDTVNPFIMRCALISAESIENCASTLRSVYSGFIQRDEERKVKLLLPTEVVCQRMRKDSDIEVSPNQTAYFLLGSNMSIIEKLPKQIKKMGKYVNVNGKKIPSLDDIRETSIMADRKMCENILNKSLNVSHAFSVEFSDIQIVSTNYIMRDTYSFLTKVLTTVISGAKITYLLFSDMIKAPHNKEMMTTIIQHLTEKECTYIPLIGSVDYEWEDGVLATSPFVIRIQCPDTLLMTTSSTQISFSYWYDDVNPLASIRTTPLPLLCEHFSDPFILTRILKFGTKTAIMRGIWREEDVVVKVMHPHQYLSFEGFNAFMREDKRRSPLIHYPILSCYSNTYSAIFQIQLFLQGFKSLESTLQSRKHAPLMTLRQRTEIAIQILCIFQFLHTQHPNGFFVYDDYHPGQFLIKEENKGYFSVRLIDIDTLQLGKAQSIVNASYPYSNYTTHCRCFYCRGRSNCMFFNTYEGYESCGQLRNSNAWNLEIPRLVNRGKLCDGSSDMWFEAQMLYFLLDGAVAWRYLKRDELIERIELKQVPSLRVKGMTGEYSEDVKLLLSRMFVSRPTESVVLEDLQQLCVKLKCEQTALECPALVSSTTGSYSSPFNSLLD
ncbi:uncharacterized protein TM35_000431340 [Trypanosoma theileri]|uniref:Protein kinase domain-containing protein n=1 Tax=Trypanosoma theileri TaxID=67003 RepID=A0A1X0NIS1_9TRYP|nr:uncharacterized protein TM35_000431340 [Trypanosoma theileri]ORC84566.1 hypothetical protein TM35_000431340 [Trypanosoma theileri]